MKTIWVLTRGINDYNQDGDYFVAAFINKPTVTELENIMKCTESYAIHVQNGGNKLSQQQEWYFLQELASGQIYTER